MNAPTPPPFDGYRIEDEEEDFVLQPAQSSSQPNSDTHSDVQQEPDSESEQATTVYDDIPKEEPETLTFTAETLKENSEEDSLQTNCSSETESYGIDSKIESLEKKIDSLAAAVETLSSGLEENFKYATQKEELFDKMYSEMAKYKDDLYAKLLKPFVLETISILDDYRRTLERIDKLTPEQLHKALRNIPADLENLLENNGVDVLISEEENPVFDRKLHQVIRTVETDNPKLDGKVAKKIRPGYAWNGTILRQEKVELYKLKK
ncbi:MAG: nucleotide exchange factor GrpE [Muribaculaceae bacterium]|nr:nucleotide exchange factor GrpE [Muribaculaceae bacterium]